MLLLLGAWLILVAVCLPTGLALLHLTQAGVFAARGDRFVVSLWLGAVVVANGLLALSLLLPLSPLAGALVMGGLALLSLLKERTRAELVAFSKSLSPIVLVCALLFATGVAAFMTRPVTYYDTGLYHYGVIQWLHRFGIVRGLALIHDRFGIASAWYALAAPFNGEALGTRTSVVVNGFALVMALFHLLLCAARCLTGRAGNADLLLVAASMVFIPVAVIFWIMPVSAAPDFASIILTIEATWAMTLIFNAQEKRGEKAFDSSLIPFILATGALTIKLSALAVAVVAALFYLSRGASMWRRICVMAVTGLLLVSPLIAYSIVTTGCVFFPVALSCMDVPWSVGEQAARNLSEQALLWGRWGEPAPAWANSWNWLWPWLKAGVTARNAPVALLTVALALIGLALSLLSGVRRVGRLLMLMGALGLALFLMLRAQSIFTVGVTMLGLTTLARRFKERNWLLATGLSGVALSIVSAPDLRFGLGYVSVLVGCFVIAYREGLWKIIAADTRLLRGGLSPQTALAALLVCGGLVMIAARSLIREQLPPTSVAAGVTLTDTARLRFLTPPQLPVAPVMRRRLNDIDYYRPEQGGSQCWAASLPCAWEDLPEDLVLRHPSRGIAAGFVRRRPASR